MRAGWNKTDIKITPKGYAMHGFGMWQHRAWGQESDLLARTIVLSEDDKQAPLIFCCMDLGYITFAMRDAIIHRLASEIPLFDEQRLVLTCTHTHSGPGGCTQDVLYNMVTPGYVPAHVAAITHAAVNSIKRAHAQLTDVELTLQSAHFADTVEVAWNRSITAWNRNPDVTQHPDTETHLAIDRRMQVLALRQNGQTQALLSLFGVHATCCASSLDKYSSDNKGKAADIAEQQLLKQGASAPVAIFAQATAGDVSPFYQGPDAKKRRAAIKGDAHYAYAEANGKKQAQMALTITQKAKPGSLDLSGGLDGILTYVDFTDIKADPAYANGNDQAYTSQPCHGVAFFTGTAIDGPGMPMIFGKVAAAVAKRVKAKRLATLNKMDDIDRDYFKRMYEAQGSKAILMESGAKHKRVLGYTFDKIPLPGFFDPLIKELKRQTRIGALGKSDMVPTLLPLQIIRIGELAIVCCPGEFTTTAGRRLKATVKQVLKDSPVKDVLISTYCNDYMGYVTTCEEYQQQCYEGGHTIFGQWTLAAFQTCFAQLAAELEKPAGQRQHDSKTRPRHAPRQELEKRTNLAPPKR